MLIKELRVSGLLSFGPAGIQLPLHTLNVLIGPNGSGKSNLLEVLALLEAAPTNLPAPVKEMGGVRRWLWKGASRAEEAIVEAIIDYPQGRQPLRHGLAIADHGGRFEVADEWIENERPYAGDSDPYFYYRFQRGHPVLDVIPHVADLLVQASHRTQLIITTHSRMLVDALSADPSQARFQQAMEPVIRDLPG